MRFLFLILTLMVTSSYSWIAVAGNGGRVYEIRHGDRWYDISPSAYIRYVSYKPDGKLLALPSGGEYLYIRDPNDVFWQRVTGPGYGKDTWFKDMCAQGNHIYVLDKNCNVLKLLENSWIEVVNIPFAKAIAGAQSDYWKLFIVCYDLKVYGIYQDGGQEQLASLPSGQGWDITYDPSENELMAANGDDVFCYDFHDDYWYAGDNWKSMDIDNSPEGAVFVKSAVNIYKCSSLSCTANCRKINNYMDYYVTDIAISY